MKICAASATPGSAFTFATRLWGRTERVRSEAPCWKSPKSERPTWISWLAVFFTPAVIESSATISPTPIATPATVSAVRAFRRSRFLSTSPPQVTRRIVPGVPRPTTYAALLRGVNLGAHNRIRMPELRALVEGLDCTDVSTYVQSGNVVFRSGRAAGSLAKEIERAIKRAFGLDVPVVIRSRKQLEKLVAGNPFGGPKGKENTLYVTFLAGKPDAEAGQPTWPGELCVRAVRSRRPGRLPLLPERLRAEQAEQRLAGAPAGGRGDDAELADGDRPGRAHGGRGLSARNG